MFKFSANKLNLLLFLILFLGNKLVYPSNAAVPFLYSHITGKVAHSLVNDKLWQPKIRINGLELIGKSGSCDFVISQGQNCFATYNIKHDAQGYMQKIDVFVKSDEAKGMLVLYPGTVGCIRILDLYPGILQLTNINKKQLGFLAKVAYQRFALSCNKVNLAEREKAWNKYFEQETPLLKQARKADPISKEIKSFGFVSDYKGLARA